MRLIFGLLIVLAASFSAVAQTASLPGLVTDQNGAVVAGAKVTVNGPSGLIKSTNTDKTGSYSFTRLPAGDYDVQASAPNLELAEPAKISLTAGAQTLDLQLKVVLAPEKVTVEETAPSVNTDPTSRCSDLSAAAARRSAIPSTRERATSCRTTLP